MSEVQVFLAGDTVPAGLDVANREGRYYRWDSDTRIIAPMVAGRLMSFKDHFDRAIARETEKRQLANLERNADGSLTTESSKIVGAVFDRDFPHGTLCDCKECLQREVARLREDLEEQARHARRDREHAVRANKDRELAREELREVLDELADRQKFLKRAIEDRNRLAREMADVRDDAATARTEAQLAKEDKAEIVSDRDEIAAKNMYLEDLLAAIWLYVDWKGVTKQLTTEERELWADTVDQSGDPGERGPKTERWWRKS